MDVILYEFVLCFFRMLKFSIKRRAQRITHTHTHTLSLSLSLSLIFIKHVLNFFQNSVYFKFSKDSLEQFLVGLSTGSPRTVTDSMQRTVNRLFRKQIFQNNLVTVNSHSGLSTINTACISIRLSTVSLNCQYVLYFFRIVH